MNGADRGVGSGRPAGGDEGAARLRFADHLDRYGPQHALWPEDARAEAERLVASDGEARAMLKAAREVDAALGALIASSARRQPAVRTRPAAQPFAPSWRRIAGFGMAALAASLVLGFVAGTTLPTASDDDSGGSDPFFLAVNDADSGGLL